MAVIRHNGESDSFGVLLVIARHNLRQQRGCEGAVRQILPPIQGAACYEIDRGRHRNTVRVQLARPAAGRHGRENGWEENDGKPPFGRSKTAPLPPGAILRERVVDREGSEAPLGGASSAPAGKRQRPPFGRSKTAPLPDPHIPQTKRPGVCRAFRSEFFPSFRPGPARAASAPSRSSPWPPPRSRGRSSCASPRSPCTRSSAGCCRRARSSRRCPCTAAWPARAA